MHSIYTFSLLLIVISAALVIWHVVAWKQAKGDVTLCDLERQFAWRQCRRRVQASGMIGLIGLGLAGLWFAANRFQPLDTVVVTVCLVALAGFAVWVILLALADVVATRIHFRRMARQAAREQPYEKNGQPKDDHE